MALGTTAHLTMDEVPVIDLEQPEALVIAQIVSACSTFGFFQVTSHGVPSELLQAFQEQCATYFDLPSHVKQQWKRNQANARGFFDDELTKQRLDWKQALDVGVPGSRDWVLPDNDPRNDCLDGRNQLPLHDVLPGFRETVIQYFKACSELSHRIAVYMVQGLSRDDLTVADELKSQHTSYLRVNYYPPCDSTEQPPPLGISPHKDAGFLTVLLQDDVCHSLQVWHDEMWKTVHPVPNSLTISTGDMAQIWSNGRYKAPLHRVLSCVDNKRYSAPFFYNPGYDTWVKPALILPGDETPKYHPVLWGYFRALRFAGDLTDLGVEIQIEDFEIDRVSVHVDKQALFAKVCTFQEPFSVEKYRSLLQDNKTDEQPEA